MRRLVLIGALTLSLNACSKAGSEATNFKDPGIQPKNFTKQCARAGNWSLAIHGGAGVIKRENFTPEQESNYLATLDGVVEMGSRMLLSGASALDSVQAMVNVMEDDPKFNAGRGAVFSAAGINEMDAAIMDGRDLNAGAVSSVTIVRNPVDLARKVMDESRHVMLSGEGAESFAKAQELHIVPREYFQTERRRQQLEKALAKKEAGLSRDLWPDSTRFGTVGAAARDNCGNLAAATSTGGLTAKEFGRVGDTPIIGAGTYADNKACAISATGTGEYFIRAGIAKEVCSRMIHKGESLQTAMDYTIGTTLTDMGGDGGIIGVDKDGNFAFSFNTSGMYRGAAKHGVTPIIRIFEPLDGDVEAGTEQDE